MNWCTVVMLSVCCEIPAAYVRAAARHWRARARPSPSPPLHLPPVPLMFRCHAMAGTYALTLSVHVGPVNQIEANQYYFYLESH